MHTVAIIGVGLIGGSFALALRKAGYSGRILGVSSPRSIAEAVGCGAIDAGVPLEDAAAAADLLYLAQPISGILETIGRLASIVRPEALVTDAGSTKAEIVGRAQAFEGRATFLGGHPMAGKEARGASAADPDLFRNRPYVLTPDRPEVLGTPAVSEFVRWLNCIGAEPLVLGPAEHDRVVAYLSHLPQLASTALGAVVAGEIALNEGPQPFGPGLADMTRLALSPYEIWRDIMETNSVEIRHALNVYIDKLTDFRDNLTTSRIATEFTVAAGMAAKVRDKAVKR